MERTLEITKKKKIIKTLIMGVGGDLCWWGVSGISVGGGWGGVHTILIRPITKLQIIQPNCIMNSVLHEIISMSERTLLQVYNF